jgi:uncharacterized protein
MLLVESFVAPSSIEGLGVFAARGVARGTLVWVLDRRLDRTWTLEQFRALPEAVRLNLRRYASWDDIGQFWLYCADDARFFNHADAPNCFDDNFRTTAMRDIAPGEELTCLYTRWAIEHLLEKRSTETC